MIKDKILVQTEEESLLRDTYSKALLNKNVNALNEYKTRKNIFNKLEEEKTETKFRLEKMEKDLEDLKFLMKEIIQLRKQNND